MYFEKRVAPLRDACDIEAKLSIRAADRAFGCVIRDLSEQGARVELMSTIDLPARFELLVPVLDEIVEHRLVELRWQVGASAGVRFVTS